MVDIVPETKVSSMLRDDGSTDGQSHSHAAFFGGVERIEYMGLIGPGNTGTRVDNFDPDKRFQQNTSHQDPIAIYPSNLIHRINGIVNQIQ